MDLVWSLKKYYINTKVNFEHLSKDNMVIRLAKCLIGDKINSVSWRKKTLVEEEAYGAYWNLNAMWENFHSFHFG